MPLLSSKTPSWISIAPNKYFKYANNINNNYKNIIKVSINKVIDCFLIFTSIDEFNHSNYHSKKNIYASRLETLDEYHDNY